ncbi:helix-turn-helix domain-containing protein [Streptomyces sp. NPDC007901]|uniref:helix-turn-helix domain-containing protein n=1 Tax=Streptomyces sp. NPDC007901 TaxID=3364785 RepID=UPI0036EAB6AE
MSDGTSGSGFAESLRELKDRSGLSYGTLAKRLHMSTSTLHRYCNGDAVPADYAPVERLARLCKAGPEELVELHRRWVLADAERARKPDPPRKAAEAAAVEPAAVEPAAVEPAAVETAVRETAVRETAVRETAVRETAVRETAVRETAVRETAVRETAVRETAVRETAVRETAAVEVVGPEPVGPEAAAVGEPGPSPVPEPLVESVPESLAGWDGERRRRTVRPVLLAGTAVVVLLGAAVLAVKLPSGGTDDKGQGPAGAAASVSGGPRSAGATASGTPSTASPSASSSGDSGSSSPSAPTTATGGSGDAGTAASAPAAGSTAPPLTVNTQPYSWESPCSQHYLIDRAPADVAPPPLETDATAWVSAHQAVSSGEQYVTLTVQGTGKESVVLESLAVRTVDRSAPLAWNDYAMGYPGVGCGGNVPTRSFTVALDAMRPAVVPEAGHRDFPFKVSESDPEVFYVTADASAYSVGWYLELAWSSGSRHGTLRIDDKGRPFRTSGNNGRPAYEFPLGGEAWRAASSGG